jgi:hypothetical protein
MLETPPSVCAGKPNGQAFVLLSKAEALRAQVELNNKYMGKRFIECVWTLCLLLFSLLAHTPHHGRELTSFQTPTPVCSAAVLQQRQQQACDSGLWVCCLPQKQQTPATAQPPLPILLACITHLLLLPLLLLLLPLLNVPCAGSSAQP